MPTVYRSLTLEECMQILPSYLSRDSSGRLLLSSIHLGSYRYQGTTLDSFHRCGFENIPVFTTYLTAAAALNEVHNYLQAEPCIWQKKCAAPDESYIYMSVAQNETRGGKPQVLVHVSTYQGNPFWNSGFLSHSQMGRFRGV